jgi:molybdate transport system substrate-binding protein
MEAVKVFCAGAVKAALARLIREFEEKFSCELQFTFGTVGSLRSRMEAGETADVAILNRPAMQQLAQQGKVDGGVIADIGRVGVGVAVHDGAPLPDVSTADALRKTLLAAGSVAYGDPGKGDSSGIHFGKVLEQLGIADQIKSRVVLAPVGLAVVELLEKHEVELGATQASVILANKNVALAGLLPAGLQHFTTYSFGLMADSPRLSRARLFFDYLTAPSAKKHFEAAGFDRAV